MFKGDKNIVEIKALGFAVSAVYAGAKAVWQAIRSCFGAGFWRNDKPFINEEGWRN